MLVGVRLSMGGWSVMVSWQEGDKLEVRPKMGGQGLKLGVGYSGIGFRVILDSLEGA